jgi:hypothetical protein
MSNLRLIAAEIARYRSYTKAEWKEVQARGFRRYAFWETFIIALGMSVIWFAEAMVPLVTSRPRMSLQEALLFAIFPLILSAVIGIVHSTLSWKRYASRFNKSVREK